MIIYTPTIAIIIAKIFLIIFFGVLVNILVPSKLPPIPPMTNSIETNMLIWLSSEYLTAVVAPNKPTGIREVVIALPISRPAYSKEGTLALSFLK